MIVVKIAREMISTATKKISEALLHKAEQVTVRLDIGIKLKCTFDKLMKT